MPKKLKQEIKDWKERKCDGFLEILKGVKAPYWNEEEGMIVRVSLMNGTTVQHTIKIGDEQKASIALILKAVAEQFVNQKQPDMFVG